jgi:hypothetical protein
VILAAFLALIDDCSIMTGAAIDNGVNNLSVIGRDEVAEAVDILRRINFKDIIYCHDYLLSSSS